jgi:ubiquinone/menaquinone biosynthesis C-methylase UbiE
MQSGEAGRPFVPGMGLDWLLPIYDPVTSLLGLNSARRELVFQADLRPCQRVLDIGCGTGSLAVLLKQLFPDVAVVGLDPDEKALARAAGKARRAGASIQFARGFSDRLDYPGASFDRVFSSFMFHHLNRREKERTAREIRRVLKPDGTLHLLDFGGPESQRHRSHFGGLHAHYRLADNDERTIVGLLSDAGLADVVKMSEREAWRLLRLVYYRARSSDASPSA